LKLRPISRPFFSHKNIREARGVRLRREEFAQIFGVNETVVARAKVMNNDKAINLDVLYECAGQNKSKLQDGLVAKCIGHILMNIDDQHISEAEHWIQKAIEADQRDRIMFYLGKDYALNAELFKQRGDKLKAQES
jgi:hypothetical protein